MEDHGGKPKTALRRLARNPRVLSVVTIGFMIAFGIMYVGQVNTAATKGYAVRDLQQTNESLRQENERLNMQISKLRSVESVKTRQAFLDLHPLRPTAYISTAPDVVAVR